MVSETAGLALANILNEKKGSIAYVTVNRPKVLNALNTPTWSDLRKAFEDARDDVAVRGVILTGAGDRAFIERSADNTQTIGGSKWYSIPSRVPTSLPKRLVPDLGAPVMTTAFFVLCF